MLKALGLLLLFAPSFVLANEQILRFKSLEDLENYSRFTSSKIISSLPEIKTLVIEADGTQMSFLNENQGILSVEKPAIVKITPVKAAPPALLDDSTLADDTSKLWGLSAIGAESVWQWTTGQQIVVAVSDTGVWYRHSDLLPNMWNNPKEIPGNKIDDDGNGFVDDVMGWNFHGKNNSIDDSQYHGTHVAGTIAAARDGAGIIGVAPNVKIMAVKFIGSNGEGTDYNGAQTIIYAAKNGARIINCSWASGSDTKVIREAIQFARSKGVLVVAAAGNENVNTDKVFNSPSGLPFDNIIAVGATADATGKKASFSNYGKVTVDISAPGQAIYSTIKPNTKDPARFAKLSGTSMASPHVAGVAALVWALKPSLTWSQVKATLLNTGTPAAAWQDKSVTGKVVNAKAAVLSLK